MTQADTLVVLDHGKIIDIGHPAAVLQKHPSYATALTASNLTHSTPSVTEENLDHEIGRDESGANRTPEMRVVEQAHSDDAEDKDESSISGDTRRKNGELSVYAYYLASSGYTAVTLYAVSMGLWIFCTEFSTIWMSWWSEENTTSPNRRVGMYMGIYAMLGVVGTVAACLTAWFAFITILSNSASKLHLDVLNTTSKAPFRFFTSRDNGELLNRFSEDMELIDMDLPSTALNYTSRAFACLVQLVILCIFSRTLAAFLPILFTLLYFLQRFYLQTSRQLRLLMIEAKAPLYTQFTEAESPSSSSSSSSGASGSRGAVTIRAFGWEHAHVARACKLVDEAQRPAYVQACAQHWLAFVLTLAVGAMAVVLVATVVAIGTTGRDRLDVQPGDVGIALIMLLSLGETLTRLVQTWTKLESSVGAVARVKRFVAETEAEDAAIEGSATGDVGNGGLARVPGACGSKVEFDRLMMNVSEGRITLDNVTISAGPAILSGTSNFCTDRIRSRFNVVPQDPFILPRSTVRFNICPWPDVPCDEDIVSALQRVRLWDLVREKGGLDIDVDDLALSAGQRQLLCFARALVRKNNSDVLVLDEATSNLDIVASDFRDCTVLAIMHRLTHVTKYDQVALMDSGSLVEFGDVHELLARDTQFSKLYRTDMKSI
ncbi:hypothetical protein VTI74DRAFT_324 [Chaetomium olivicolor]